ncbi:MAG TPA: hypothetical protein PLJ24_08975, partial [Anaerolineae bacterium]|nr:hypothetical protein [Anaerolineae bacterium]
SPSISWTVSRALPEPARYLAAAQNMSVVSRNAPVFCAGGFNRYFIENLFTKPAQSVIMKASSSRDGRE